MNADQEVADIENKNAIQDDMKPSACIIEARVISIVCSRRELARHWPPWRDISWPEQMV